MSIRDAIIRHQETELFAVLTSWSGEETPRFAYVSLEVGRFLWEPDPPDRGLSRRSKALVDGFVEGGRITIGWDPFDKGATCIMARVNSPSKEHEIWDVRCLDPKPGARILGAFAAFDVFVGVTWDYRVNFDNAWPEQIGRCIAEWDRLFGQCKPFRGEKADEYVSQPFAVVKSSHR